MAEGEQARQPDRLVVVFAPGLWPFRSDLDGVSWLLGQGVARAFSRLPGFVGYATPEGRVDGRGASDAPRVPRALPSDATVARECDALGASLAVTGRLLVDRSRAEAWLNLIDGPTRLLLWTGHVDAPRAGLLFRFTGLLRQLLRRLVKLDLDWLTVHVTAGTGSLEALMAYARAQAERVSWDGSVQGGVPIIQALARAAVLDHQFAEAASLLEELGMPLVARVDDPAQAEALRAGPVEASDLEVIRRLRRALHERLLALAEPRHQT